MLLVAHRVNSNFVTDSRPEKGIIETSPVLFTGVRRNEVNDIKHA